MICNLETWENTISRLWLSLVYTRIYFYPRIISTWTVLALSKGNWEKVIQTCSFLSFMSYPLWYQSQDCFLTFGSRIRGKAEVGCRELISCFPVGPILSVSSDKVTRTCEKSHEKWRIFLGSGWGFCNFFRGTFP